MLLNVDLKICSSRNI